MDFIDKIKNKEFSSENDFRSQFNFIFFNGNGQADKDNIDLFCNNITFESKYNSSYSINDMYIQLIATHQKNNIPFKSYIGVFNENEISFMKTERLKERIEEVKKMIVIFLKICLHLPRLKKI